MSLLNRSLLILLLLFLCVGCDQLTKDVAQEYFAVAPPQSWFYDTVRLEYAENNGGFLSLGADLSDEVRIVLFRILPVFWLLILALYLVSASMLSVLQTVAWSLVLSGGVGNVLDRMLYDGRVVDFLNLGIGSLRTGIFNVADVCVTLGVFLLVLHAFQRPAVSTPG